MPRTRLHIVVGIGMKKPICRDTLASTAREAKILAVNNMLRSNPSEDITWRTLHEWGYRCVPITVSYRNVKNR